MSSKDPNSQDQDLKKQIERKENISTRLSNLESRVQNLTDIHSIRKLHFSYGYYIDTCQYSLVVPLFSATCGEVIFLSGRYKGHEGVSRLYQKWFHNYFTQGRPGGSENGFLLDHLQMQDIITISPSGLSAKARFRALLLGGSHEDRKYKPPGLPDQFMEGGVYENEYVKEEGVWKIKKLDYVVQWQAEYEKGWAGTMAHLKPLEKCWPEDPLGPDELLPEGERRGTWPEKGVVKMHWAHPVLEKMVNGEEGVGGKAKL